MDQLHDSPSEDSVLFIHWFVYASHLGMGIIKFAVTGVIYGLYWCCVHQNIKYIPLFITGLHAILIVALILLCISGCIARRKRYWFLLTLVLEIPTN